MTVRKYSKWRQTLSTFRFIPGLLRHINLKLVVLSIALGIVFYDLCIYTYIHYYDANRLYVQPISVPTTIAANGFTSSFLTDQVLDQLHKFDESDDFADETAHFTRTPRSAISILSTPLELVLKVIGYDIYFSTLSPLSFLHTVFGSSDSIVSIKLLDEGGETFSIYGLQSTHEFTTNDNRTLPQHVAMSIYSAFKPCTAFFYQFQTDWPNTSFSLVDNCAKSTSQEFAYLIPYFRALIARKDARYIAAMDLVQNSIARNPFFKWALAEESNLAILRFIDGTITKQRAIAVLTKNRPHLESYYRASYYNGFLYLLSGNAARAREEFSQYLARLRKDTYEYEMVLYLLGLVDKDNRLDYFEESVVQGQLGIKILLGAELFPNENTRKEAIYWLQSALKDGNLFAVWVYYLLQFADDEKHFARDIFNTVFNWLETDVLENNPYAALTIGALKYLQTKFYCSTTDEYSSYLRKAYKLFSNEKYDKDPFSHLFRSAIAKATDAAPTHRQIYHAVKARRLSADLRSINQRYFDALAYLIGTDDKVDVNSFINAWTELSTLSNSILLPDSLTRLQRPNIDNLVDPIDKIMRFLALFDTWKLSYSECLSKDMERLMKEHIEKNSTSNEQSTHASGENENVWIQIEFALAKLFYQGWNSNVRVPRHRRTEFIDYEVALLKFVDLALLDHAEAQLYLALMYSNGRATKRDCIKARYWLQEAKRSGSERARATTLGKCS